MPTTTGSSSTFENDLHSAGFDICHPFDPSLYDGHVREHDLPLTPLVPRPTAEDGTDAAAAASGSRYRGYLIGNTKHLWPIFLSYYHHSTDTTDTTDTTTRDPLDTYCRRTIAAVLRRRFPPPSYTYRTHWSCETDPSRLVSMQRVASSTGLSYLDHESHLAVHPVYGTWHSFRAVVVLLDGAMVPAEIPLPPPVLVERRSVLTEEEETAARSLIERAVRTSSSTDLCGQLHGEGPGDDVARVWIELRDCVALGRERYRFGDGQLWYHYTKDEKYIRGR